MYTTHTATEMPYSTQTNSTTRSVALPLLYAFSHIIINFYTFLFITIILLPPILFFFFFNDPPPPEIYLLPLHAALPICPGWWPRHRARSISSAGTPASGTNNALYRPAFELADIFRRDAPAYRESHRLSRQQERAIDAIVNCRTAALGGHVEECGQCSHTRISYNSCRNRHCPKCQSQARAKWVEA